MKRASMKASLAGKIFIPLYAKLPLRQRILNWIVRHEGGDMYSLTLREVLDKYFKVTVGNYSYGSLLSVGSADSFTEIGRYVSIGPNVRRFGAAHPLEAAALHPLFYNPILGLVSEAEDVSRSPCQIDDDVWIGANVTILPGCRRIGSGAVVGAGSVVTKDVPPFAIVAGNPALVVRERFSAERQQQVLRSAFWELEPEAALERIRIIEAGALVDER